MSAGGGGGGGGSTTRGNVRHPPLNSDMPFLCYCPWHMVWEYHAKLHTCSHSHIKVVLRKYIKYKLASLLLLLFLHCALFAYHEQLLCKNIILAIGPCHYPMAISYICQCKVISELPLSTPPICSTHLPHLHPPHTSNYSTHLPTA